LKVLLISEDTDIHEFIKRILKIKFPKLEVVSVLTVEESMTAAASDGPFAVFILDSDLKQVDPNALGLNLIEFTGERPIIFIGTESIFNDRITEGLFNSHELNDKAFKPFDREDFVKEIIQKMENGLAWILEQQREQSVEEINPDEYIPMKIKAFFLYQAFPYDVYIAITQKSYMKIINANTPYPHSLLTTYARKNIKFLHIKKDEQLQYLENETKKCLKQLKSIEAHDKDIYLALLRGITIMQQYMLALGVTASVHALVETISDCIVAHFKAVGKLSFILKNYPNFYEGVASKSLLTAFIAESLAWKIGWESNTTKKKLAICSLLQDITLSEDSLSKINSQSSEHFKGLSPEMQEAYNNHPISAADYSKQFTQYSDIDYIIESHHELPNRKGFPNRPAATKLTQICAVFNIAQYVAAAIDGEQITDNFLSKIHKSMSRDFNIGVFKEVMKVLKDNLHL